MSDLGSEGTKTNTNTENWLKSSKNFRVEIGSKIGSKPRNWNSDSHSFFLNGMWFYKNSDSSSRITGMRIKTDSKMLLKLGNNTGDDIDSKFRIES